MYLENLRTNYPKLLSRLEEDGYSAAYIASIRGMIKTILTKSGIHGWGDYYDVRRHYEAACKSEGTLIKKRTIIGAIMEFDLNGKFPDRTGSALMSRGAYYRLLPEFRKLIDNYKLSEQERGIKESSVIVKSSNASSFFLRMQEAGALQLSDITEEMIVDIFLPPEGAARINNSQKNCIAGVIRANIPFDPHACRKMLNVMPMTRRKANNVQYLTDQEAKAVLLALDDMSNSLTLRDRAVGKLAYFTGMRSSDIAMLDMSSIDWNSDIISLKQQKTSVALQVPLRAVVGNAIFDYISRERPSVECSFLFLSKNKPYRRLTDLWHTSAIIMSEAGIRQEKGDRRGFHIFRHHMATKLMNNGVSQAVIANVTGHADPDSLESYLSANIAQLRECALSIEQFPVDEEVFFSA